MEPRSNFLGQPVGRPVPGWTGRPAPSREPIQGRRCRLEPLIAAPHADALHAAFSEDSDEGQWTYLPYGPFDGAESYRGWAAIAEVSSTISAEAWLDPRNFDEAGRQRGALRELVPGEPPLAQS